MSFLLPCPNCGPREVEEFHCAGETTNRPAGQPTLQELTAYLYLRRNTAGVHREWWYHRAGCRSWLVVERDTRTHAVASAVLASALSRDSS